MARRADRSIRVTGWSPSPGSVIPHERDVLSGLPVQFDHVDKSRQAHSPNRDGFANGGGHPSTTSEPALRPVARSATTGPGIRVAPAIAVGAVVVVVAVIAGAIFLISRVRSTTAESQPASPTGVAPTSVSGTTVESGITSAAITPATVGVGPPVVPAPPPSRSPSGTVATPPSSGSNSGSAIPTSSAGTATTPKNVPPLLPATAIGLDGTYRLSWRVTAESIAPGDVSRLGNTGTLTFVADRDCAAAGCRTTVVGDIYPVPPGDAGAWTRSSRTETITCRAVATRKPTGGSWRNRVENMSTMTAHQGVVVTAGIITQKTLQVSLCPGQTSRPLSATVEMTFKRIGP